MNDQLEISETNKERNQIIVNRKYKFNLWYITNNNIKVFKCTEYKTANKCKSYITLNDNDKVIKYENKHTHSRKNIRCICINTTYELLFEELKKNASKYNNNIIITPKILHCNFEKGIFNAAIKIFPNISIKYCVEI
ncbi:hypothetical protein PIROE2DRAFT_1212 [Piromyces sp. E2]|nr:hypothetical protein PIROE2DRAFT_1212 [Piromyces sp. E2]|eukprot:OUM70671.1 hypothetical protein PIROE2DRAFT_1212 [Piromyces sp. E2]